MKKINDTKVFKVNKKLSFWEKFNLLAEEEKRLESERKKTRQSWDDKVKMWKNQSKISVKTAEILTKHNLKIKKNKQMYQKGLI